MTEAERVLARAREMGANIVWDGIGRRIYIANSVKLPTKGMLLIKEHAVEISRILRREAGEDIDHVDQQLVERAAIIEFDGRAPREWAEQFAALLIARRPVDVSDDDWRTFIDTCSAIIDAAPSARAVA